MKRTWPSRIRWYSSAIGSLTLRIRSPVAHTSSAAAQDRGAGADELVVGDRGAGAGACLDEDLVTVPDELVHAGRGDRHPVLVVLDLAGDADLHAGTPPSRPDLLAGRLDLNGEQMVPRCSRITEERGTTCPIKSKDGARHA